MIYSLTVTNSIGESLTFELSNPWVSGYAIKTIDGLGTPDMNVNTTPYGIGDGSVLGSIKAEYRLITIVLYPLANPTVETMRQQLYRYFQIKKPILLSFNTENRLVTIDGYVQKIEPNIFDNPESISIEVKCINPYFHKMMKDQTNFYGVVPQFEFPFSVPIDMEVEFNVKVDDIYEPLPESVYSICLMGNQILLMGNTKCLFYSDGLGGWEQINFAANLPAGKIRSVAYGNGVVVCLIIDSYVLYSLDLRNWNYIQSEEISSQGWSVCYQKGIFVLAGSKYISYSKDGIEWAIASVPHDDVWRKAVYENGLFFVVGDNYILNSENGIDWKEVYAFSSPIESVGSVSGASGFCYGKGLYVCIRKNGDCVYSTDLKNWTLNSLSKTVGSGNYTLKYGNGVFFLIQVNGSSSLRSKDLIEWTSEGLNHGPGNDMIFNNGAFVIPVTNGVLYLPSRISDVTYLYPIEFSTYSIDNRSEIEYEGEIDAGLKITIECQTAPGDIVIYNVDTLDYIQIFAERVEAVTGSPLGPRDVVEINTEPGEKYVRLLRNGVYYNILGAMNRGMTWFTLKQGPNKFTYTTSDEHAAVVMSFSYRDTYAAI